MLAEAKREVDRMLGEAREQAAREASQTEIVRLAEQQAQEIVEDAQRQGPRDAPRDGGLGGRHPLDARGQPGALPHRRQARPRAAARALARRASSPACAPTRTAARSRSRRRQPASASSPPGGRRGGRVPRRSRASATRSAMPTGRSRTTSLRRMLDAGRLAGSSKNSQPWRFVVVESPRRARAARRRGLRAAERARRSRSSIAVLGKRNFDTGRAAQNMMLAAWNEGVASSPTGDRRTPRPPTELLGERGRDRPRRCGYPARPREPAVETAAEEWSAPGEPAARWTSWSARPVEAEVAGGGRVPPPAQRRCTTQAAVATCTSRRVETPASMLSPALRARAKNWHGVAAADREVRPRGCAGERRPAVAAGGELGRRLRDDRGRAQEHERPVDRAAARVRDVHAHGDRRRTRGHRPSARTRRGR